MDEQMVRALLELGKVTFKQISERAVKAVTEKTKPEDTWLSVLPHQVLQAYQGVHGHGATVAAARRLALIEELGEETGQARFNAEAQDPSMVFLLAGLAPPIDPIDVLFQTEPIVAAWKAHYEETEKSENLAALALLSKIAKIKEQYGVSEQYGYHDF